ncbi:MAG: hypothetical protein WCK32_09905 [Chlorobiaceae bacterium]
MSTQEVIFNDFLEVAGKSFGNAQKEIGLPEGMNASMLIADAELAVKVGVRYEGNNLMIEPISAATSTKGNIIPEALSTITVRYVASRNENNATAPVQTKDEVIKAVAERADLARIKDILGTLNYDANYAEGINLWTVRVTDSKSRTVRTITVEDKK